VQTSNAETARQDNEIDLALCRAALYSALALGFRPPTEQTVDRLVTPESTDALADAAAALDAGRTRDLAQAARAIGSKGTLSVAHLLASYRRLFGHTVRSPVAPYETEYGAEALFQQPQELADLIGFYRAFGLTMNTAEHERADHVCCEYEFLCFLSLKEAYALEQGDAAMLEETVKAQRLFLRDHVGRFVPAFAGKLTREDGSGFYAALAELASRFAAWDCARLGVPLGPESLSLRPATDDRVPMACGGETECPLTVDSHRPQKTEI